MTEAREVEGHRRPPSFVMTRGGSAIAEIGRSRVPPVPEAAAVERTATRSGALALLFHAVLAKWRDSRSDARTERVERTITKGLSRVE